VEMAIQVSQAKQTERQTKIEEQKKLTDKLSLVAESIIDGYTHKENI
jgi:hypothetical protein